MMKKRYLAMLVGLVMVVCMTGSAFADEVMTKWTCEKKSGIYEGYGAWKEGVRAYTSGNCTDKMSCHTDKKVNSTYSGELKVSIPKLESFALMKHEINKSFSVSVKY